MLLRRLDALDIAHSAVCRPISRNGALLRRILHAEIERIHADRLGDLIEHALGGEGSDRCSRPAISCRFRPVADHVDTERMNVLDVVGRERATGGAADRRPWERTSLQLEQPLRRRDRAVFLGADLDGARRTRRRPGCPEHFFARHRHLDRPPGLLRQDQRQRLEINDRLAAEPAADLGWNCRDAALRQAGQVRGYRPHHEVALRTRPDLRRVLARHRHETGMRFDIALVHRLGRKAALNDHVGFRETFFDIAELVFQTAGNVRRLTRGIARRPNEVMQDRRVRLHRVVDVDDVRQHLVLDFDQLAGLLCDRDRRGGNRGHRVPREQHLVLRHHVAAHPAHVGEADIDCRPVDRKRHDIVAAHDGLHTRQRQRLVEIDRLDPRMGMLGAQHAAVKHTGRKIVRTESRLTRHLFHTVRTDGTLADPFVVVVCRHLGLPYLPETGFASRISDTPRVRPNRN